MRRFQRIGTGFARLAGNFDDWRFKTGALDRGHCLIIAATNSGEALDKALFRRFDSHLYFPLPTLEQITDLMKLQLATLDLSEYTFRKYTVLATGMSFADVSRACNDAIKSMALAKRRKLQAADLLDSCRNLKDRLAS